MNDLQSRLLVVTDRKLAQRPLEYAVAQALEGGARWIWFRDRDLKPSARLALGERLLRICADAGATLSVGGTAEEALTMGARGVHLPTGGDPREARAMLGDGAIIGVSAHSVEEAARSASCGANYVTLSPIYESASKPGYGPALGACALRAASQLAVPVVALGGVSLERVGACLEAGAAGVAVMGAVMSAPSIKAAARALVAECAIFSPVRLR